MFRAMRRSRQAMPQEECAAVLERGSHGVLALAGDGDYPYAVPISYVYTNRKLYFHCAKEGHKTDLLRHDSRVCITFVGADEPAFVAPAMYTTYFQSAVVIGRASEVTEPEEKAEALRALCRKLTPHDLGEGLEKAIEKSLSVTAVWRVSMDQVTGKAKLKK